MCHYTYALYTCCNEPTEYDNVQVFDVEYCPISADCRLYDGDFFHCPYATGECLGDSDWACPECSETFAMEDDHDDLNEDKEPYDDSSDYSDVESEGDYLPPSTFDRFC